MANPHKQQRRREAANEDGLHETRESHRMDWTDRDDQSDRTVEHHHHHHHYDDDQSDLNDRDYERMAEQAHAATAGDQRDEVENDEHAEIEGGYGNRLPHGNHGESEEGRYDQRRKTRGRMGHEQGSPRGGSQRGSLSDQGVSGRATGQRGDIDHHENPSYSTFREPTDQPREHRFGGDRGTSERDRRFGSRHGHGSERQTDDRPSSH